MATLAIAGAGFATSGVGLFGTATTLAVIGNVAALAVASYVDNAFLYPALFGSEVQQPQEFQGLDMSTQDTGAPRTLVFGSACRVPLHVIWMSDPTQEGTSVGGK